MSTVTHPADTAQDNVTPAAPATLTIEGKQFGRSGKSLFPNFQMPVPASWQGSSAPITLRDLIEAVVRSEVSAFQERQEKRTVIQALTAGKIAEGVARGKVDSGGLTEAPAVVDVEAAIQTALLAFADGLYFVFLDDAQIESLDDAVTIRKDTRVTFLRLVAMAGG